MNTSSSPLGQLIQSIMREHQAPMAVIELQQQLRRKGYATAPEILRDILRDTAIWTTLANDKYSLRDIFDDIESDAVDQTSTAIYLSNLRLAYADYCVLDLETTGFEPESNQIIQIAILRVIHGKPDEFRNWDVQCDPDRLDPSLRRVLHLDSDRIQRIASAPPIDVIWPAVRRFIGEQPLVIHNARFDMGFLLHHDPSLQNPIVDSLELALLVFPYARKHTLNALAEACSIRLETINVDTISGIPSDHRVAEETLHDAITDVLVLAEVYRALLHRWEHSTSALRGLWAELLPSTHVLTRSSNDISLILPANHLPEARLSNKLLAPTAEALLDQFAVYAKLNPRSSQRIMVETITAALLSDTSRLIEAPTGTGKTLGYLIPAIWEARRTGRRIGIATAYKNLQDQLHQEIIRLQKLILFNTALIKGASNYLCLRELQAAIAVSATASWEQRYLLAFLVHWVAQHTDATLDEIPFWLKQTFSDTNQLLNDLAVQPTTCTERRCQFYDQCHFFAAQRRAEQADILIINQAIWLNSAPDSLGFDALIIDEAHNLEDMATSAFQQEVGEHSLRRLLTMLYVPNTRRGLMAQLANQALPPETRSQIKKIQQAVGQALRLIQELRSVLATFVLACDETFDPLQGARLRLSGAPARIYPVAWLKVQQALDQLWKGYLNPLITELAAITPWVHVQNEILGLKLAAVQTELCNQQSLLATMLQARFTNQIIWIAVQTHEANAHWAFCTAPLSVAEELAGRYKQLRSVILTSATLTTGPHDFSFFVERLGLASSLTAAQSMILAGALPYQEHVVLGLPAYLNYTPARITQTSFVEELAAELQLLLTFTDGRALMLFTSRQRLEHVYQHNGLMLETQGIPVFAQRPSGSRQALIDDFKAHGNAVLYGLKSFWEGVDVPGTALSFVIMEKLPYPAFNDPIHAARREAIARQNGREFQEYLFPLMVLQFKQGFGRLLRTPTDRGAVILYDKRIGRKSYLPLLLGALPGYQPRDLVAEQSRRAFYTMLANRLPDILNLAEKADFLATVPDILLTDLEALIERLGIPDPLTEEDYDDWRPQILDALQALYGFAAFRSTEQEAAFRAMLTGRDVMAVLPTGAGKSICFQLPALLRQGTTIICSPLIALMKDQVDKLYEKRIEVVAALMSGQNAADREEILARLRAGRLRLLYLAPERLRDPVVLAALASASIRQIVADEAHCIALWGPSFRPDFLMLPQIYQQLQARPPIAAFTATATTGITEAIISALEMAEPIIVRSSIDRPELRLVIIDRNHRYHPIRSKTDQIRQLLLLVQTAVQRNEAMLIYVSTVKEAEYLARLLQVAGIAARAYHGRMDIQERTIISEQFMDDLLTIIVCTKAFGMGIDKPDIRYVVHFNMPGDLESYFQEIGRAGRDGKPAYAVMLYHPSDRRIHEFFIAQSQPDSLLLAQLWAWMRSQPPEWILNPQQVCEDFEIDELELRRMLYLLEQSKLIRRGADVTIRGSLTLLGDWQGLIARYSGDRRMLLEKLANLLPQHGWLRNELHLADLAAELGVGIVPFEAWLIEGALHGYWIYRPWEKGYHITRFVDSDTLLPRIDQATVQHQQAKLQQMQHFVRDSQCRWQALRLYFGEACGLPCNTCDRCTPEQYYPWSNKTSRDVPDVSDFLDLAGSIIAVVWWNERRMHEGKNPFGSKAILQLLRGDEYRLMYRYPAGPAADARRNALRSCPYWGVCRTLRRSTRELQALLDRLIREDYISIGTAVLDEDRSYEYLALTPKGQTQRLSATRLEWDAASS
ncbi:RecQ family ATP-dependent DNA helicase [Herpetosiphon sp. NSE202]|uniref:RecQ family ATP-dependent DNA helicase n=1 Tax=Herpetosiphon sp. NSE202 TaxID=3351349 RepID=UPI003640E6E6